MCGILERKIFSNIYDGLCGRLGLLDCFVVSAVYKVYTRICDGAIEYVMAQRSNRRIGRAGLGSAQVPHVFIRALECYVVKQPDAHLVRLKNVHMKLPPPSHFPNCARRRSYIFLSLLSVGTGCVRTASA